MTTYPQAAVAPAYTNGNTALSCGFDSSTITSLIANRHSRFTLDLSNHSLIGIMEAYETHKQRENPKYTTHNVIAVISKFADAIGEQLLPIDVNDIFYQEFEAFLVSTPNSKGKLMKPSTIKNYFNTLAAALGWASKHGCKICETYHSYNVSNYEKTKVALSPSQISHIYYWDIERNHDKIKKTLEQYPIKGFSFSNLTKVRDQFVLNCNLGQRYSDAIRLNPSCFDDTRNIFRITQQKTGGRAIVNLSKYSIDRKITFEILQKYDYTAPCIKINGSNFNRLLHLLLRTIGGEFNTIIKTENKVHGYIVNEDYPMWQAISSHTARRTFVTYWMGQGIAVPYLQKCTGHKDVRQISRYTILNDED